MIPAGSASTSLSPTGFVVHRRNASELMFNSLAIFSFSSYPIANVTAKNRVFWFALQLIVLGIVALLGTEAPLLAQSGPESAFALQECAGRWNLQSERGPTFARFTFGSGATSYVRTPQDANTETVVTANSFRSISFPNARELWSKADSCGNLLLFTYPSEEARLSRPESDTADNDPTGDSNKNPNLILPNTHAADRSGEMYYRNKLEFSLEGGWLPINVPFPFDFLLGSGYNFSGLYYTLVPVVASVRWQVDDVGGPQILRGNWDVTFSGTVTLIPRGAETRYFAYMMGIRRNFVPHRRKAAPYFDGSLGMGNIDAKGPLGVEYAQGQPFTFTLNLGTGVRYNFSPRYGLEAGMHYMHISNLYLSEPKFLNYGLNVYGPWAGINIRLGKHRAGAAE